MSIIDIELIEKEKVFIRLIEENENISDAFSKSGITISSKMYRLIEKMYK